MNLAYKFPIVFWNTANLIVDSGGVQFYDNDEVQDDYKIIEVEQEVGEDEIETEEVE